MVMAGKTTIEIKKTTRDTLLEIGKMHDSYDDLLIRLIEEHAQSVADTSIGYYSDDEMCDLVSDPESFREYVNGLDDAVVQTAYKKSYVDAFRNR